MKKRLYIKPEIEVIKLVNGTRILCSTSDVPQQDVDPHHGFFGFFDGFGENNDATGDFGGKGEGHSSFED